MFETYVTVVGRIVTAPEKRRTLEGHSVVTFRMASNERRFRDGEWGDGDSLYLGVTCWRSAADNVHASLLRGDPVVVRGRLRTREYLDKEGNRRSVVDMEAQAIGPDLFHATARVGRAPRPEAALVASDPWADALASSAEIAPQATDDVPDLGEHASLGGTTTPAPVPVEIGSLSTGSVDVEPSAAGPVPGPGAGGAPERALTPEVAARDAVDAVFEETEEGAAERPMPRRRPRTTAATRAREAGHEDAPTEAAVRV